MSTLLKVRYRGKDLDVNITAAARGKDDVKFICSIPQMEKFEITINEKAMWVIVGKQVVSKSLVAVIGDTYVNSLI